MASRTSASTSGRTLTPGPSPQAVEYVSDWQLFPNDLDEGIHPLAGAGAGAETETEPHDASEQTAAP